MNLFVLTFFIAAAATDPATTGTSSSNTTNGSKNSATTSTTPKKNSKSSATIVADPNAPQDSSAALPKSKKNPVADTPAVTADAADPAAIVGSSIDAATQIANEAAKAALEEAAKLSAIGSDSDKSSNAGSVINSQAINAAADGAVAVAKEIKKPKAKKATEDTSTAEDVTPKPAKKPKASNSDGTAAPAPVDNPATKN